MFPDLAEIMALLHYVASIFSSVLFHRSSNFQTYIGDSKAHNSGSYLYNLIIFSTYLLYCHIVKNMARPSKHLDEKLLKLGHKMMLKGGASEISINKLCRAAKVNNGMFVYHFKSRDAFIRDVFGRIFDQYFSELQLIAAKGETPAERLENAVIKVSAFLTQHQQFVVNLIRDGMNGEKVILDLLKKFAPLELSILVGLIIECQKAGQISKEFEAFEVLAMLGGTAPLPIFLARLFKEIGPKRGSSNFPKIPGLNALDDMARIKVRVRFLLRSLAASEVKI